MTLPRTPRAVIFDMDGLIFDTEALYTEATVAAARELGGTLAPELCLRTVGLPAPAARAVWIDHFGKDFDVDAFWETASRNFHSLSETRLVLKPGVEELLDWLDARQLPRAIATSTARATVDRHLLAAGLDERFDAIVALGDYPHGKPHPAPYLTAADRLDIAPEHCLALEDSHNGVRSASSAGMMTVMVPDLLPATDEMRGLCVAIADNLHAVRALLLGGLPD